MEPHAADLAMVGKVLVGLVTALTSMVAGIIWIMRRLFAELRDMRLAHSRERELDRADCRKRNADVTGELRSHHARVDAKLETILSRLRERGRA